MSLQIRPRLCLAAHLLVGALAAVASAGAQEQAPGLDPGKSLSQYRIDGWTETHGLPQSFVRALAQTIDGYLWLGTEQGLVRFDGVRFTTFDRRSTPELTHPQVDQLLADPDGGLWIGTHGGGVIRWRNGKFTSHSTETGLSDDFVRALHPDPSGGIWVGTEGGGLDRIDRAGRVIPLMLADGLSTDMVTALSEDGNGGLWVGTRAGLNRVHADTVERFKSADGLPSDRISALLHGRDGTLWIGTTDGGLARLENGRFTTYTERDGLASEFILSLHEDSRGTLWVGTNGGGLLRYQDGRFSRLETESVTSSIVWAVREDREGNLWVGGGGLIRVQDTNFTVYGEEEGMSVDIALATLEDRAGALWIGTAGGGLNRFHEGRFKHFGRAEGLAHEIVVTLAEARDGSLWIGSPTTGVSRYRDGRFENYGTSDGLASDHVNAILEGTGGALWIGTYGAGLQRWHPDSASSVTYTSADGLASDFVHTLLEDGSGTLWIGTREGLSLLRDGRLATYTAADGLASDRVGPLYEDAEGTLWIGTQDGGLSRLRDGRFTTYTREHGLFDDMLHSIVEDRSGNLWMSSNTGIFRVRKAELNAIAEGRARRLNSVAYGTADGLRTREANGGIQPAAWRREDGTLWFPTMAGIAAVDPERLRSNPLPPPVVIERIVAGDQALEPRRLIELPAGSRTLEFQFTAPSLVAPEKMVFRYQLEGFDTAWIEVSDRRTAYYTNVPPGRYRFRVTAANEDGVWNARGAAVELGLAPHFHETWAFYALVGLVLTALAGAAYGARVRQLKRREAGLLTVISERERAEEQLERSLSLLRASLDSTDEGIVVISDEGDIATYSGKFQEMWEVPDSILVAGDGERLGAFLLDRLRNPADFLRFRSRLGEDPEHESRARFELKDGRSLDCYSAPYRIAGTVAGRVWSWQDVTERLGLETQLRQSQKLQAVGRLAGGIAHDFNNLLNVIKGTAALLRADLPEGSVSREDAAEIEKTADRAASLTHQLLAFSRRQVLQPQVVDLNGLVREVSRMLERTIREDIELRLDLAPELRPVEVDAGQMHQVLMNLAANARDAMPQGGVLSIETRNAEITQEEADRYPYEVLPGPYVDLRVSDTGLGMGPETQAQIFEPFFTTKAAGEGTGLGLATVYGIVKQSGGYIWVRSTRGAGTVFDIYIPPAAMPPGIPDRSASTGPAEARGETVLVVEDNHGLRKLFTRVLARQGYEVLEAGNGREALGVVREHAGNLDLVVSDVIMPVMNGTEMAQELAVLYPRLRILFTSGYTEVDIAHTGLLQRSAYLQKPVAPDALIAKVREILDAVGPADRGPARR